MDRSKIKEIVQATYPDIKCKYNYRCMDNGVCEIVNINSSVNSEKLIKCNYPEAKYCINSFSYGNSYFCLCKPHQLILDLK